MSPSSPIYFLDETVARPKLKSVASTLDSCHAAYVNAQERFLALHKSSQIQRSTRIGSRERFHQTPCQRLDHQLRSLFAYPRTDERLEVRTYTSQQRPLELKPCRIFNVPISNSAAAATEVTCNNTSLKQRFGTAKLMKLKEPTEKVKADE